MTKGQAITVKCPECGGADIVGADVVKVVAEIAGWERDDAGRIRPVWSGISETLDGQSPEDPRRPFYCNGCDAFLSLSALIPDDCTP